MIMLTAKDPCEIAAKLDDAKIPKHVIANYREPQPGDLIPEHFHCLLNSDLEYHFRNDELVAYELEEEDVERNAVYVFAKIVEKTQKGAGLFEFTSRYKIDIGQDEVIEVNKCRLYKFDRAGTKVRRQDASGDIVPYEGTQEANEAPMRPRNLEEAKREIAEALKEIWKLPEPERRSAIRRLIKVWHPDRNPNDEELATEATKFLLNEVERLENGGTPGYREPGSREQQARSPNKNRGNGPRRQNDCGFDYRGFSDAFGRRRKENRRNYERWQKNARDRSNGNANEPVNKPEAQRWLRQARVDLDTAKYLYRSGNCTFYGASGFYCQQTAEKCLKAILFAKGKITKQDLEEHEMMSLSYRVSGLGHQLLEVPELVMGLRDYYIRTRYPHYQRHFYDHSIPAEKYTAADAEQALASATKIYELIEVAL